MPPSSLLNWIERGVVRARRESDGLHRWIVWADAAELERLRAYRHRDIAAEHRQRWQLWPRGGAPAPPLLHRLSRAALEPERSVLRSGGGCDAAPALNRAHRGLRMRIHEGVDPRLG